MVEQVAVEMLGLEAQAVPGLAARAMEAQAVAMPERRALAAQLRLAARRVLAV